MPCPVDLRKYLRGGLPVISNLTSNYLCDIAVAENDVFCDALAQVSVQLRRQKGNEACLKSTMMAAFFMRAIPLWLLKKHFTEFFPMPMISYTNLGVLSHERLCFGKIPVAGTYLTAAVKRRPLFQIAVSTFGGVCSASVNLYGSRHDRLWAEELLDDFCAEVRLAGEQSSA